MIKPEILTKLRARTSASQITSFVQCQRRWHIGWVLDEKTPPGPPMLTGTDIHAVIEPYLINGTLPKLEDIKVTSPGRTAEEYLRRVEPALALLAPPATDSLEVEQEIDLHTYDGGPSLYGRFDAIDHERRPTDTDPRELRMVFDNKCISDFKYAKTPEALADDVQLGAYAKHELELYPQDEAIRLRHVYVRTRGAAKAMATDAVVSRAQVEDRHARTVDIIRQMQEVIAPGAEVADPNDLPPNTESCNLYGGCPHRTRCGLESSMSLSKLFSTKPSKTNKETVPMSSLLDRLRAKTGTSSVNGAPPPATTRAALVMEEIEAAPAAAVVPPDAPARTNDPTPAVEAAAPAEEAKPKRTRKKLSTEPASPGRDPELDRAAFPPEEKAAIEAVFDKVLKPAPSQEGKPAPSASLTIEIKAPTGKVALPRPTVYIDCVPTKGPHAGAITYEEWLAPIQAAVAEELQIADWRLADYGKGEGVLAAAIRSQLADLPEAIVVNGISKARGVFLECIAPLAKEIIKGV